MSDGVQREMRRGDTLQFSVQVFQAPPNQSAPQNIIGWFAWFTAKYTTTDSDAQAVMAVTSGNGGIVFTQPFAGKMMVTVPAASTVSLPEVVNLVYDIQVQDLAGNVTTIETGTIEVDGDVTRAIQPSPPVPIPPFGALFLQAVTVVNTGVFATLNAAAMPDGSLAYVPGVSGAFGSYFVLLSQSQQTVDGVKCFAATPVGRWRLLSLPLA